MRSRSLQRLDYHDFPILYVDDEPDNLRVFELTFRNEFSILTATSAEEGMVLLNENRVAVVLSDQRMPGVTGVEFLARVRSLDSSAVRILVTAYGDVEILGSAINEGCIYRYIPKPWEPEDMRLTLQRAIEAHAMERERCALVNELSTLNRLSRSLHHEIDRQLLSERLLDSIHSDLGFDGAALLLLDSEETHLSWEGLVPSDCEVARHLSRISIRRSRAPQFFDRLMKGEPQMLRIGSAWELEAPIRDWVTQVSADEVLVVPLIDVDRVVGVLAVDNRSGGQGFGREERALLEGLAGQAAVAIKNARLVEDLRTSRAQILRADRLGTLGTLTAGFAHEINNPLVAIHTFMSLAPEMRDQDDETFWGEYHCLASGELSRIRDLVSSMASLAGGGEGVSSPSRIPVDFGAVALEVGSLMEGEASLSEIELRIDISPGLTLVSGIRHQLHQLILNLLINALHATSARGLIELSVMTDQDDSGEWVQFVLSDNGQGIAEENLERIFAPFYTTKKADQGSGLGLMIAHQIVADHEGSIEVSSELGVGTRFTIRLPAAGGR